MARRVHIEAEVGIWDGTERRRASGGNRKWPYRCPPSLARNGGCNFHGKLCVPAWSPYHIWSIILHLCVKNSHHSNIKYFESIDNV
jgi:hypothetical protein